MAEGMFPYQKSKHFQRKPKGYISIIIIRITSLCPFKLGAAVLIFISHIKKACHTKIISL